MAPTADVVPAPVPVALLAGRPETDDRRAAYGLLAGLLMRLDEPAGLGDLSLGPFGQPLLPARAGLHVSLAHTGSVVAAAVARGRRVGIDVEAPTPFDAAAAALVLTPGEGRAVDAAACRGAAFLRLWVRKEAVGKALGLGLAPEIVALDVGGQRVEVAGATFAMYDLAGPLSCRAALAVEIATED